MLNPQEYRQQLEETVRRFREAFGPAPDLAVVFGSGLGKNFMAAHPEALSMPFNAFPHLPSPQIAGHQARISRVQGSGKSPLSMLLFQGRVHYYEGYAPHEVVYFVRALALWGVKRLLLTNASGSIRENLKPGQIALIEDHLNCMGVNPLIGANLDFLGTRFPSLQSAYRNSLAKEIQRHALKAKVSLKRGVYVGISGPSYETDAEVQAYRRMGGDLIGMSTVLEAIAAAHAGMEVAALAAVSNFSIKRKLALNHAEVLHNAEIVDRALAKILQGLLQGQTGTGAVKTLPRKKRRA